MNHPLLYKSTVPLPVTTVFACLIVLLLSACAGNHSSVSTPTSTNQVTPQTLTFPNVGITDLSTLDPALGPDQNAAIVVNMIYSGLVRTDKNMRILSDQATWQISPDLKTYTFLLKPGLTFSDGTPITAQSYIYTWTRALSPSLNSPIALSLESPIVGASDVYSGQAQTISGLRALEASTLQITLTKPTPYFLSALTNSLFFPLNQKVIEQYGDNNWVQHVARNAVGTGPFVVASWQHNVRMVLVPNPYYYGDKTRITKVNMPFVDDPIVAFKSSRAGQYDFIWGMDPSDQSAARGSTGFLPSPLFQTDALFFDTSKPPFDNLAVRQAFAYALDKFTLAHSVLNDSVVSASTILPPGMPGYQSKYAGLSFDAHKAHTLLASAYPDSTLLPALTFSFPNSQVSSAEASALAQMWQSSLGVQVTLRPVEDDAYDQELSDHLVSFGFTSWTADFPDPYDFLSLYLSSNADNTQWHNADFDHFLAQAEASSGNDRLALYAQAEQIAISDVALLPIDHQNFTAVIPSWVRGVSINGNGLYFGDWSQVYLLHHS